MDASSINWLSEWQIDEDFALVDESQMNILDDLMDPFTTESFSSNKRITPYESVVDQKPHKKIKTTNWNSGPIKKPLPSYNSSSSITISFGNNSTSPPSNDWSDNFYENKNISSSISQNNYEILEGRTKCVSSSTRTGIQAKDHVLAERKRREKLTERFLTLSSLIPQLTKIDKASVLGDAIKYIKELKDRVEKLEGEVEERNQVEIVAYSSNKKCIDTYICTDLSFPEIEVRVLGKSILIRIYSENKHGFIAKALNQVEKLNLNIISSDVIPFANNSHVISITAPKDDEFNMSTNDLVQTLHSAIKDC